MLTNKGINNPKEAKKFLEGDINDLHSPYLFRDIKKAIKQIKKAIDYAIKENIKLVIPQLSSS